MPPRPQDLDRLIELTGQTRGHALEAVCDALARLGPEGRKALYQVARKGQSELCTLSARALHRAALDPAVRPAALDYVTGLSLGSHLPQSLRISLESLVIHHGWASGIRRLKDNLEDELFQLAYQCGYPIHAPDPVDPLDFFPPEGVIQALTRAREQRDRRDQHIQSRAQDWKAELETEVPAVDAVGRNQTCPCGSGKKFKKCCLSAKPGNQNALWLGNFGLFEFGGWVTPPFRHHQQSKLLEILLESKPRRLEGKNSESDAVLWSQSVRLLQLYQSERAQRTLLTFLSRPTTDAALDRSEILALVSGILVGDSPPDETRRSVLREIARSGDLSAISSWTLTINRSTACDAWLRTFSQELMLERSHDTDALLVFISVADSYPTEDLEEFLEEMAADSADHALALETLREMKRQTGWPEPVTECPQPSEGNWEDSFASLQPLHEEFYREAWRSVQLQRGLHDPPSLATDSVGPWYKERAFRQELLNQSQARMESLLQEFAEKQADIVRGHPEMVFLADLGDELLWLLPASAQADTLCSIAAASGKVASELGWSLPRLTTILGRWALRQRGEEDRSPSTLARVSIEEVFASQGSTHPDYAVLPLNELDRVEEPEPPPLKCPETHPWSVAAQANDMGLLEFAALQGSQFRYQGRRAQPDALSLPPRAQLSTTLSRLSALAAKAPTAKDVWLSRLERFPNLQFCPAVRGQLLSLQTPALLQVLKRLGMLQAVTSHWQSGPFPHGQLPHSTPDSQPTLERYGEARTFTDASGRAHLFSHHLRFTPGAGRLYYQPLGPGQVLIGYLGVKLPTVSSPTV